MTKPSEVRRARIVLGHLLEPGHRDLGLLVDAVGPVQALGRLIVGEVTDRLRATVLPRLTAIDPDRVADDAERRAERLGVRIVTPEDDEWPHQLDDLRRISLDVSDRLRRDTFPPHCVWLRGPWPLAEACARSVAVVGSRASTSYGDHVAGELAFGLAERGWTVVSGGAYGIDAAAHRGALAGGGRTVVVLACGVDRPYPSSHAALFDRVGEEGLLLSEWPPGSDPHRHRFLHRHHRCRVGAMNRNSITRAHWGDLSGMNFAGLVRLSFEPDLGRDDAGSTSSKAYLTGRDIKGRNEQEKDCRGYVVQRQGEYVYTYAEPDTSAFKRRPVRLPDGRTVYRVIRPVFEGALEDLKRGTTPDGQRLDGLVVYDIDRLTRDNRHLEDCIEVVEHFDRPIIDIAGTLDLLTDNGRTVARIIVATYNKQSADAGRRIRRKHQALQQAGIPVGGQRPFGWLEDKRTLHPKESEILGAAARRVLEGASMSGIVVEWNEQGITSPLGKTWTRGKIVSILRNPRICGLRARKIQQYDPERNRQFFDMEIVRKPNGDPVVGLWQPILTVEEWEALTEVIGRNHNHALDFNSRKYLLTNILRCGKPDCGKPLRATRILPAKDRRPGMFNYGCPARSEGGCGGVHINGPKTEEYLVEAVIAKFELEAEARDAHRQREPWPDEAALADVRQQIQDLTTAWRARPQQISSSRYFALLPDLEAEERTLASERERWLAREFAATAKPLELRGRWPKLSLPEQRSYIREALASAIVYPCVGVKRWKAERLELVWRQS